jgi:L-ascorbate metabolism protein UlaG (beta-lactamase superfamily)
MSQSARYLKPNIALEPLYNQWWAWPYLISPVTAPLMVANNHVKIMQSFVEQPALHVAALSNPALAGGPYLAHGVDKAGAVGELLARTRKDGADLLQFAQAVTDLHKLLAASNGYSLEEVYQQVPDLLRGYVELTYNVANQASPRFLEALLYRSPYYREASQSLLVRTLENDARPYSFSTPRLDGDPGLHLRVPYRHEALDTLFAMRATPGPVEPVREALGLGAEAQFSALFTDDAPPPSVRYEGPGVRVRYFGHACVLLESRRVSILTDPCVSYAIPNQLPRYTAADLPPRIDYVLITHGHADHLMLEPLLALRGRIGTVIVPASSGGRLVDPSLKLLLRALGFRRVVEIQDLETMELPGGEIMGVPFLGEHCDLEIRAKIAHLIKLEGRSFLMAADSNAIEPRIYDHLRDAVGELDALFLGMESEGGLMSWMYGPLMPAPLARKMDQSRRLSGSNGARAIAIVERLQPRQIYVYAMGREPWFGHLMALAYTEASPQLVEVRKLLGYCREHGLTAEMPYGQAEIMFSA